MSPEQTPGVSRKILFLTPQFPYPPHQGTTIRNYNLISGLAQRHEVHLLSFGDPERSRGTPLDQCCQSVEVVPPPQHTMTRRIKGLLFSGHPDMAQRLPSPQFQSKLEAILDRTRPDVLEVEGIELAQYLLQVAGRRAGQNDPLLVFDDHNAEYVLQQRAFETDRRWSGSVGRAQVRRWFGAAYSHIQWRRLERYERQACQAADRVVAVSETDAQVLRDLVPGLEPIVVPNGVDMDLHTGPVPPLPTGAGPGEQDLVFTGKMDFRPNVDAVLWFAREVLPRIRREAPEVRLWVVGMNPHSRLAVLADEPAVEITGWVEHVRPFIAAAAIYVVPLRIGGGTRLKILQAMAMGKPIVSTGLGCEGFDVAPGQELVIADAPDEFASATLELLRDPDRRQRLGRAARSFAGSKYDWQIIVPQMEKVYEGKMPAP